MKEKQVVNSLFSCLCSLMRFFQAHTRRQVRRPDSKHFTEISASLSASPEDAARLSCLRLVWFFLPDCWSKIRSVSEGGGGNEWEGEREREREGGVDGWIRAEQLPTPLECECVVTSLSISIFSQQRANTPSV